MAVLTNPEAPLASAHRLVTERQVLPAILAEPVTLVLCKWLAECPDCLGSATQPDSTWCDAAQHAHRNDQRCVTFRRRKRVTEEARMSLKWITLVAGYAGEVRGKPAHKDPFVQTEARKLLRGLTTRRMTWDQATEALKGIRSLVQTHGRRIAEKTPVRTAVTIPALEGLRWREVVTIAELSSVGRSNGLCTHEKTYSRQLKSGDLRFFILETLDNSEFVGLASIDADNDLDSLRGPGNCSLSPYRSAVIALLDALSIRPGRSSDLLDLGIVEELPGINLQEPDRIIGTTSVWFAPEGDGDEGSEWEDAVTSAGAILVRVENSFGLLKRVGTGYILRQGSSAEFDGDDLLGRLLMALNPVRGSPRHQAKQSRSLSF